MSDTLLDTLMSNLEYDFRKFRKELNDYKYVVDLKALTKAEIALVTTKLGPELFFDRKDQDFLVLKTKAELNKIGTLLTSFKDKNKRYEGPASQERTSKIILEKSNTARSRLNSKLLEKTEDYMRLASPMFKAEFISRVSKKISNYNITFNLPVEGDKRLKEKFISSARKSLGNSLKDITPGSPLDKDIKARLHAAGIAFETGKLIGKSKQTSTTKKSDKQVNKDKVYYTPLQDTHGVFASISNLTNIVNLLLHDTIEDSYMEDSAAPASPAYLRYQTGRFARSAEVSSISKVGDKLNVSYGYMTNPYGVFEASGTFRDPRLIISGAIRDIIKEHVHKRFDVIIGKI